MHFDKADVGLYLDRQLLILRGQCHVHRGTAFDEQHRPVRRRRAGASAVSNTARGPLAWTSATLGSPTATRLMASGRRSSCCRPWSISITEGNSATAAQPLSAACAQGAAPSSVNARHNGVNNREELRMAASLLGQGVSAGAWLWAPRIICMPATAPLGAALAGGTCDN